MINRLEFIGIDEVQSGLLKCLRKLMSEDIKSSTFEDAVKNQNCDLIQCFSCSGYDLDCVGYRYQRTNLNNYNKYKNGND